MRHSLLSTFLFLLLSVVSNSYAGTIKGRVNDENGEPAIGATIMLDKTNYFSVAGLDGSFTLKNVPNGKYTLKINMISYEPFIKELVVKDSSDLKFIFSLKPLSNALQEVEIVGQVSGTTDEGARHLEKSSDNINNILSGKTIQLMPDVTVANVLRRVSGVTVSRGDNGEGRYPVIRGMDKRYNYTLVNGVKIPSPDNKNRYVPMDVFPSELLQRLEVVKALRPDMEGDAIGGVMNMVMKDAPEGFMVQSQLAVGYSQMAFNQKFTSYDHSAVQIKSPAEKFGSTYQATYNDFSKANLDFKRKNALPDGQFNIAVGNRFFKKKLGLIFCLSTQSTNRISNETFFEPNSQPNATPTESNVPAFSSFQQRTYSTHDDRIGANMKADYRFNPDHKLSFYTVFMQLNSYQSRITIDSSLNGSRSRPGTGTVEFWNRSKTTKQEIINGTLQGQHAFVKHLFVDWSGVYSLATQQNPDQAELVTTTNATINPAGNSVAAPPILSSLKRFWQHNSDRDLAGYLNLHYKFKISGQKFDIGAGGLYRNKERSNYYNTYTQLTTTTHVTYTNIYDAPFTFVQGNGAEGSQQSDPNIYNATEDIAAGYFEVKWTSPKRWNILAGVRAEHTMQTYTEPNVPVTTAAKTGTISYLDLLPSVHVKYNLNEKQALHASYFSSISRPGFFEIVPYVFPGDYYNEIGNPYLKHVTAKNVDLRYELFPKGSDQLLIGGFYKSISNAIEYIYVSSPNVSELQPQNVSNPVTNIGAELVFTKYFNRVGFSANYTYTRSDIITSAKVLYVDATGATTTKFENVHRPLQGQAANIGNLALLYKDVKKGLDLQVAAVYTGRFIAYLSNYEGLNYWQKASVILDFSGQKKIAKRWSVYAKCNNLLNTATTIELIRNNPYTSGLAKIPDQTDPNVISVQKKHFGQTYLIGIRYNM